MHFGRWRQCAERFTEHVVPQGICRGQVTEASKAGTRIYMPQRVLTGKLGEYRDGLFAFLMFDHYRSAPELKGLPLLLKTGDYEGEARYSIWVRLPDDLIRGTSLLAQLRTEHFASEIRYRWVTRKEFQEEEGKTARVADAFSNPTPDSLDRLDDSELTDYLGSFIRFKSLTDFRIEHGTDPSLSPLDEEEAARLAGDMIAVAHFYDVPLSLLVGIGAMENNYMNAPGDLTHTLWKPRPQRGDIVLERRRRRVLVKDDSMGVWQITRKELRRAQGLYRRDKRDYAELPAWLRPPEKLDWDNVEPAVLTTYAGLLLRDLLDRCHDDAAEAAGAYNGTVKHPNFRYAEGVQLVAEYAQRMAGNAAEVDPVAAGADVRNIAMPDGAALQTSLLKTRTDHADRLVLAASASTTESGDARSGERP